jgi:hypothetical protein
MAVPSISNAKKTLPIFQASTTAAATASGNIDVLGFDYVTIDVLLPTADVVSNKPTVLKLSESDDTVVTNFTDITAFVGGGTGGFTIPNAITAATSITLPYATFNVDARARKRYLKLSVSPATTQVVNAVAQLTRAEQTPATSLQATVVVNG